MCVTRLVALDDAPAITALLVENREFMAPWEPFRDDDFFTVEAQREIIGSALERMAQGLVRPHVILDATNAATATVTDTATNAANADTATATVTANATNAPRVVGRINLSNIVRGAFQSASVGYWVGGRYNGRGLATAAVKEMKSIAFGELDLHRLEAGTLPRNIASQRVLERNGFERFGLAPRYLRIAGEWQDHILFQVLNGDASASASASADADGGGDEGRDA